MIPPFFSDLLKEAKKTLFDGYTLGILKLEGKAKAETGASFNGKAETKQEDGSVKGMFDMHYNYNDNIRLYEKWSTNNIIKTDVQIRNLVVQNLRSTIGCEFCSSTKEDRLGYIKNTFFVDPCALNLNLNTDGQMYLAGSAYVINNLAIGAECTYDINNNEVIKYRAKLRYAINDDTIFGLRYKKDKLISGSIFYKGLSNISTAALVKYNAGESDDTGNNPTIGIGCKYQLADTSSIWGKVVSTKEFAIAYHHKIENVFIGISALFDLNDFQNGHHQAGLNVVVEL